MILKKKYNGKTVIITGHTGFKGSWLSIWLHYLGANVIGISNNIPTKPSNFEASNIFNCVKDYRFDITDNQKISELIKKHEPDFIFNLAAQSLVVKSYEEPIQTFLTNAIGTINILDAVKKLNKKINCVMITSDKAYRNFELKRGYHEEDIIGGKDPYSASKGMAEIAIYSYFQSFFNDQSSKVRVAIGRAGNVIGGGDWAPDRIVPDCMNAWSNQKKVKIRNPKSTRPWQHVLEPLSGYLLLGLLLDDDVNLNGEAFNFGPPEENDYSVKSLIEQMSKYWNDVNWLDDSDEDNNFKEAGLLKLDCNKAKRILNWKPVLSFDDTARMTVNWYKEFYNNNDLMYKYTTNQIHEYSKLAKLQNLDWAK